MIGFNLKGLRATCVCIGLLGAFFMSMPSLAQPEQKAQDAWKARRFSEFLTLSIEREKKQSSFANSFNVALGLFMTTQAIEALKKILEMQLTPDLSGPQRDKIIALRVDIESYLKYREVYLFSRGIKFSGQATLSTGQKTISDQCKRFKGNQSCPPSTTGSAASEKLFSMKPDEQELYVKALSLRAVESNGYDVTPKTDTRALPEE